MQTLHVSHELSVMRRMMTCFESDTLHPSHGPCGVAGECGTPNSFSISRAHHAIYGAFVEVLLQMVEIRFLLLTAWSMMIL